MKHYNIDEFVWFDPTPAPQMAISFPRERYISMNAPLFKELGRYIDIAFHPSESVICLRSSRDEKGIKLTTGGVITSAEVTAKLISVGICPPVRLDVVRQDEYWIAVPEPVRIPDTVDVEKASKRPRKVNPARVLNGLDAK